MLSSFQARNDEAEAEEEAKEEDSICDSGHVPLI